MSAVKRTKRIMLTRASPDYAIYREMAYLLNNCYNYANYLDRQRHINGFHHGNLYPVNGKTRTTLWKAFQSQYKRSQSNLYKSVSSRLCQQIINMVENNFKNWIKALRACKKHPELFKKKPRMPKAHPKGGYTTFMIDNQSFKFDKKHQIIQLHSSSKRACWWRRKVHNIQLNKQGHITKINQITVVSRYCYMELMISYNVKVPDICKDNGRYFGIDPGYENLMVTASNVADIQPLKTSNGFYRRLSYLYNTKRKSIQSELMKVNHKYMSAQLNRLDSDFHWQVYQFYHKACNQVIAYAVANHISRIIIGVGSSNAQNGANLGKALNQGYCRTPYSKMIKCLQYKAIDHGLEVIPTEESYTSQSSFLDGEAPVKQNGNKARALRGTKHAVRRAIRGIFISNDNWFINADLNGALQIIKKQRPHAFDHLSAKQLLAFAKMPKVIKVFKSYKLEPNAI